MNTPFVKVETVTVTRVTCKCPSCGDYEWTVSHLFEEAAKRPEGYYSVQWNCDACFTKFAFRIYADQRVELSKIGINEDPLIPSIVLLRSTMVGEGGKPIYAVLSARSFKKSLEKEKEEPLSSGMEYYYNQHTCPTNWLREVIALVQDGEADPHGCFEFLGARSRDELIEALMHKPGTSYSNLDNPNRFIEDNLALIFPELFNDNGDVIEGEVAPKFISIAR